MTPDRSTFRIEVRNGDCGRFEEKRVTAFSGVGVFEGEWSGSRSSSCLVVVKGSVLCGPQASVEFDERE